MTKTKPNRPKPGRYYTIPPEIEADRLDLAQRRRQALAAAGCATYELGFRGGVAAIQCLCCGLGSSHPDDIREKYCGFCKEFHAEWSRISAEKPSKTTERNKP